MTDERKKYLASISKKERIIRERLLWLRYEIKDCKCAISHNPNKFNKEELYFFQTIVKALKKQLPAPIKETNLSYEKLNRCPICGIFIRFCDINYCCNCGQKLR